MSNTGTGTTLARRVRVGDRPLAMLPENAQWKNRFEIRSESSDRVYVVAQRKTNAAWACSCPGYVFHGGRECKHLRKLGASGVLKALATGGG